MQAAEALRYIHTKDVVHSDLGSHNFLIQDDGALMLADFGGSMIDDTPAKVAYATRYARPCRPSEASSPHKDDMFALGTIIYEIGVGHRLCPKKSSRDIHHLLRRREFPDLDGITPRVRPVIGRYWAYEYEDAGQVLHDLRPTSLIYWPAVRIAGISLGLILIALALVRGTRRI